eukprot:113654_1
MAVGMLQSANGFHTTPPPKPTPSETHSADQIGCGNTSELLRKHFTSGTDSRGDECPCHGQTLSHFCCSIPAGNCSQTHISNSESCENCTAANRNQLSGANCQRVFQKASSVLPHRIRKKSEANATLEWAVVSDIGLLEYMEDSFIIQSNFQTLLPQDMHNDSEKLFIGVYDGHSGAGASQYCRDFLHEHVASQTHLLNDMEQSLIEGFLLADLGFHESSGASKCVSGTTSTVMVIDSLSASVAHLGDSRAVLCRAGRAIELTADHCASVASEKERIEFEGGFVDNDYLQGILEISRAMGGFCTDELTGVRRKIQGLTARPDVSHIQFSPDDEFLIVATDGLWDVKDSSETIRFARRELRKHNDLSMLADQLVKEAIGSHSFDNVTVVVLGFRKIDETGKPYFVKPAGAWIPPHLRRK